MNNRVLVTGGSGFIGTNMVDRLLELGDEVLSIDILPPRKDEHKAVFNNIDLKDFSALSNAINAFQPDDIIHLAARTDLDAANLDDYEDNTLAVSNLCKAIVTTSCVKKVIFASSMLVCHAGYIPIRNDDYCPTTIYGQSKVKTEEIISQFSSSLPDYFIVRPTSIWGPWFDKPYKDFFDMVLAGRFLRIYKRSCSKTYGYVENSVNQIISLLLLENIEKGSLYYVGDAPAVNVNDWSIEISSIAGVRPPFLVPYSMLKFAALIGDVLKKLGVSFPLTSFRLKNMTTDNVIPDLCIANLNMFPVSDSKESITKTIQWINNRFQN